MELIKDMLLVTGRIYTIYPLMLIAALFMGRRSIGEMPVFDFLVVLSLGSVVGADIADPNIEHIHTAVAIVMIAIMQRIVSSLSLRFRRFGKLVTFEPVIVVHQGQFLTNNLRNIRYSIDNVLRMLRTEGIFDVSEVEVAILEGSGKLTVQKRADSRQPTAGQLGLSVAGSGIAIPVILDGWIDEVALRRSGISEAALLEGVRQAGAAHVRDVYFASVNGSGGLHVSLRWNKATEPPEIRH